MQQLAKNIFWHNFYFKIHPLTPTVCSASGFESDPLDQVFLGIMHLASTQNFPKTNISLCQGTRNGCFTENVAFILNE